MAETTLDPDPGPWWRHQPHTLSGLAAGLETDLDSMAGFDLGLADGGELADVVVMSQRLRAKFAAIEAALVGRFDANGLYRRDGSRSTATWLAARSNTPRDSVQAVVRRARRLRTMPVTAQAFAEGRLAQERVDLLAREAASPRPKVKAKFIEDEDERVDNATGLGFDEFRRDLAYWRDEADPDGEEDKAQKQYDSRRVHLSQSFEGQWFLDGLLDTIQGAELAEALRRIDKEFRHQDRLAAEAIHGEGCAEDLLARTPAQRRADALVELARRAMAAAPGSRKPAPLFSILVGYETFAGPILELFNGIKVTAGQVARRITEADIERVVFDPASRDITDLGRRSRFFTKAQRRVIEIRDRTCWHPDCDEPAEQCDADHVPPWTQDGQTNISSGRAGCPLHNRVTQATGNHPEPQAQAEPQRPDADGPSSPPSRPPPGPDPSP